MISDDSPLVQRLWAPVASLPRLHRLTPQLPERLDLGAAARAPSLSDAPLDVAVLAVGTDPAPYSVGGVAVMSPDGDWRTIDRARLGMRDPDIVEQQYVLSPDGRTLALGDAYGIVLVDIGTGDARRVPTRADDVVLHAWSSDSSELVFTPRNTSTRTLVLDVASRTVRRAAYDAWASASGPEGRVVELVDPARAHAPSYTGVRTWLDDDSTEVVPLGVRLLPDPTVGRRWDTYVAVVQRPRRSSPKGAARGVVALDPDTGVAVALLAIGRRQSTWTSVDGATRDGWLLVQTSSGPGGGVAAWDPARGRLRGVIAFDEVATDVEIATDVLVEPDPSR